MARDADVAEDLDPLVQLARALDFDAKRLESLRDFEAPEPDRLPRNDHRGAAERSNLSKLKQPHGRAVVSPLEMDAAHS